MIEKVQILVEMKLAGLNIEDKLEKMYKKYGKKEFQSAIKVNGYQKLFGI